MKKSLIIIAITLFFFSCKDKTTKELPIREERPSAFLANLSKTLDFSKFSKVGVTFDTIETYKFYPFKANYRQSLVKVSFPYPFSVKKIFVTPQSVVKKGDRLFEISSDELNTAIKNYQSTGDEAIAFKLKALGIPLNNRESISSLIIVSPASGTLTKINIEENQSYPPMDLAEISLSDEVILEGTIASSDLKDDTSFSVLLKDGSEVSAKVIETISKNTYTSIKLAIPNPKEQNGDFFSVKVINRLENTFKIPHRAVLKSGNNFFVFLDLGEGLVEKREVKGFYDREYFVITEGVKERDAIFVDGIEAIAKYF